MIVTHPARNVGAMPMPTDPRATLADRIANDFAYHPPATSDVADLHGEIRAALRGCALFIAKKTPPGPEQLQALGKLREAMFWANAAIACGSSSLVGAGTGGSGETVPPSA